MQANNWPTPAAFLFKKATCFFFSNANKTSLTQSGAIIDTVVAGRIVNLAPASANEHVSLPNRKSLFVTLEPNWHRVVGEAGAGQLFA